MHFESIFQKYFQNLSHEKHGSVLTWVDSGSYVYYRVATHMEIRESREKSRENLMKSQRKVRECNEKLSKSGKTEIVQMY